MVVGTLPMVNCPLYPLGDAPDILMVAPAVKPWAIDVVAVAVVLPPRII